MDNTTIQTFQAHLADDYERYHTSVYLPDYIEEAAEDFLPLGGVDLLLSNFYWRKREEKRLPRAIRMPQAYQMIDVTLVEATKAVFRVCIRFPWTPRNLPDSKRFDMQLVLEGDGEVVTAQLLRASRAVDKYVEEGEYEQEPTTD